MAKEYFMTLLDGTKIPITAYEYHRMAYEVYRRKKPPTNPKLKSEYYKNLSELRRILNSYK